MDKFRAIAQYTGNSQQDNSRSGVCVSVHVHYACITNIPASQLIATSAVV